MSPGEVRDTRVGAAETAGDGQAPEVDAHAVVTARAQAAAGERAHGAPTPTLPPPTYAGLVTRAIAFAIDAAIVNLAGVLVGVVVALGLSILDTPDKVDKVLLAVGGGLFVIWTIGYFVAFWSSTGQTPGNVLMRIRVRQAGENRPPRVRWALVRFMGLVLAAIPLLLGFLPMLLNDRRRALQDFLGRTVVVHAPAAGPPESPTIRRRSDAQAVDPGWS